mgnify:CR=1 FL=1
MFSIIKETADNEPQGRALAVSLGCIEALEQGNECLKSLSDDQYNWAAAPHITSTIGEHFRHLLDLFHAINLANGKVIDYNFRRRGHAVEKSREAAIKEIEHLIHWLEQMNRAELITPVNILTEVSMTKTQAYSMASTLERELTFVALHANHHFAMAKVTISLLDLEASDSFGFAPNTLSYLRGQ